jgi:hypothetical protein
LETHEGAIRKAAAISRFVSPAALRAIARSRRSIEYGAVIHAGLLPAWTMNQSPPDLGIPIPPNRATL